MLFFRLPRHLLSTSYRVIRLLYVCLTHEGLVTGAMDAIDALTGVNLLTTDASEWVRAAAAALQIATAAQYTPVQIALHLRVHVRVYRILLVYGFL